MRGCLFVLVLAAVFVVAGAWFGGPALAGVAIGTALDGAGFESRTRTIDVANDPPIAVLTGRVDEVRIGADDASFEGLAADRLDVTLFGVDLAGRSFATIEGELTGVMLLGSDGRATPARSISLIGEPESVRATVHLAPDVVEVLVAAAIEQQLGFTVGSVTLEAPDRLVFEAGPIRATARLTIEPDGALFLAADVPGNPRVRVLASGEPLVFREVLVGDEVVLVGTIELSDWLR
jgi:hypothetical protein